MADDRDLAQLAAIIYSEGASTKPEVKAMIGSTVLNRLESGRVEEFGGNIGEIGQRGYYAVKDNTDLYQQATTGKFPDKVAEKAYKESLATASGLMKGTIDRHKAMFYFEEKEEMKIRNKGKAGKKQFNFDVVKRGEDSEKFRTYHY